MWAFTARIAFSLRKITIGDGTCSTSIDAEQLRDVKCVEMYFGLAGKMSKKAGGNTEFGSS